MFTCNEGLLRPGERALRGRRLVAVDIENIAGGAIRTSAQAHHARTLVEEVVVVDQTQVIIGVSRAGLLPAYAGWGHAPHPRYVVGWGLDGADLALIDVLDNEDIGARFDEVVLASGDGIFAGTAARLGASGVHVTVVGHRGHVAKRLIMAASAVVFLDHSGELGGAA